MPKHGIDHVRFGNGRESVLGTSTGFASDVKEISEPIRYSQEHNNTQYKHDASARHSMVHANTYMESTVTA